MDQDLPDVLAKVNLICWTQLDVALRADDGDAGLEHHFVARRATAVGLWTAVGDVPTQFGNSSW